jgi:NADPH:quinone reductase-like Zn-dependent oxidoreductase
VLGRDAAGVVEAVGPGVEIFGAGDAVFGMPGIDRGCYAEYVILKQNEAARTPASLDRDEAAAVPLASLTAWQGLFRHGGLTAGQKILIHGGSGGVGHFAIQFAKAKGAYVVTTVSADHFPFVRRLGADEAIDYEKKRFEENVKDVDVVFDLIGGDTQDRSWDVLKKGGVLVSTVAQPSPQRAEEHGARGLRYTAQESAADLTEIAALIEAGQVKPTVSKTFALASAAAAQKLIEQGHTEGKIVLIIEDQPA